MPLLHSHSSVSHASHCCLLTLHYSTCSTGFFTLCMHLVQLWTPLLSWIIVSHEDANQQNAATKYCINTHTVSAENLGFILICLLRIFPFQLQIICNHCISWSTFCVMNKIPDLCTCLYDIITEVILHQYCWSMILQQYNYKYLLLW